MAADSKSPDTLLSSYIEAEKAKIKVDSYDDKVVNSAFRHRTYGFWAGTTLGLGWGTVVGVGVVLALPLFLGAAPTMAVAAQTIGMFSAIGALMGNTSGQIIGAAAGASSAAARERERRDKAAALEIEILKNPPDASTMQASVEAHTVQKAELDRSGKGEISNVQDIHAQTGSVMETMRRMVKLKPLLTAAALGAAIGMLVAVGGQTIVPGLLVKSFGAAATTETLAVAGAVFGAFTGASFGFAFPPMFTTLSKLTRGILSGSVFEKEPAVEPQMAPAPAYEPQPAYGQNTAPEKSYAASVTADRPRANSMPFVDVVKCTPCADKSLAG